MARGGAPRESDVLLRPASSRMAIELTPPSSCDSSPRTASEAERKAEAAGPRLLQPPWLRDGAIPPGALVLCFAFGQGPDRTPGNINRALAGLVRAALPRAGPGAAPRILAQWEIARELEALGVEVTCAAELGCRGYITTREVLRVFAARCPPAGERGPIVVVGHPDHAWRCWALSTLAGYAGALALDARAVAAFRWAEHGCDLEGYDPDNAQEHTTSGARFRPYEEKHQLCVQSAYPDLRQIEGVVAPEGVAGLWRCWLVSIEWCCCWRWLWRMLWCCIYP